MSCVFTQRNLVSSIGLTADFTDPNNINPIGQVINNCTIWVSQNGTSLVSQYELTGQLLAFINTASSPSGLTFNPLSLDNLSTNFLVTNGTVTAPANLILVTTNGVIQGINPQVNATDAITVFTGSGKVFYGVALAQQTCSSASITPTIQQLYVTNFASGFVEVYNATWSQISQFTDTTLTSLGYGPLGIAIDSCKNLVYVTFALRNTSNAPVPGIGLGFVDLFTPAGALLGRFASAGPLNIPYGLDIHSNYINVGNNGDGRILRYNINDCDRTGTFSCSFQTCQGGILENNSLWAITTNPNTGSSVFFNAGINDTTSGLTGRFNHNNNNNKKHNSSSNSHSSNHRQKSRRLQFTAETEEIPKPPQKTEEIPKPPPPTEIKSRMKKPITTTTTPLPTYIKHKRRATKRTFYKTFSCCCSFF